MQIFWRLLGFLSPYRRGVIASFLLAAIATGFGIALPALIGMTVNRIQDGAGNLWPYAAAIVGAGVLRLVFSVARRLVAGRVSLGVEFDLRSRMYGHLQALELGFFDGQQTGQLMSRATVDLSAVRFFLGYGLIFIAQSLLSLVVAAIVMLAVNVELALVALAPVPFVIWAAARYGSLNRPASQEVQQRIAELTAEAEENVSGVRVVKAFAQEARQFSRFTGQVVRVFDQSMYSTRIRALYQPLIGFLPQIGLAAILVVGGRQVLAGTINLGDFVAFYGYVLMLVGPLRTLGVSLGMAQRAVASGARVFEILDREPLLRSPDNAVPMPAGRGRVEIRGATVGYGTGEPVLRDIDLTVEAGSTVALVGTTGSGKTSLAGLVPRLYDPIAGTVSVDGVDVKTVDLAQLREQVALVSDDAFLFSTSIRDNIAYARPDASDQEVEQAARAAGAHDFISALAEGYGTRVGERGLTLSGGQRQRLAIARAVLRDARILILDDATSSVDATKEGEILEALARLAEGRTTFVIGHRLSTIRLADHIVVLDNGGIAAEGDHEQLLCDSPLYRQIAEQGGRPAKCVPQEERPREVAL
ncbi:MAG: ATP-binding cassette, subfamily bacterial [Thermoleophilaceae bacterium]|jgi:ATP-binding cassette subfamily B protein|nr:ATP-binding cassette, subfamily bacterial [Thermoleophilaceae bacterium]